MAATKASEPNNTDSAYRTSFSLIVRVMENDPIAWERLVRLYSPLVYFWCRKSGLQEHDLHDVFQEVFYTLARNIRKFRNVENGTFRGWLRTLARNQLNDHFRKLGRVPLPMGGTEAMHYLEQIPAEPISSLNHSAEGQDEIEIQHSLLIQALANVRHHFAEQTWRAFWMVVVDGREAKDVAKDLEMLPGAVRVAKARVLKRLRLEIGDSVI
jgi:RNA polymerase sigma-70 factor, ECF subfamily